MSRIFAFIKNSLRFILKNIGKIFFVISLSILFVLFLFPLNDLSDFISGQVSKLTNHQYYIDFEQMRINVLGGLGLELDTVYIETPRTSPISLKQLIASPSFSALLYKKPQGKLKLKGLFKGDVEISISNYKGDNSSEKKVEKNLIALEASKLDLSEIKSFLVLPINFKGRMDLNSQIVAQMEMIEPPEIQDLSVHIKNFEMPQTNIENPGMLPIEIPGLKLSELTIKGRYAENKFLLQEIKLGKDSDEVLGTVKGNLQFLPSSTPFSSLSQYEFNLDLKMKKSFYDKVYLALSVFNAGSFFTPISGGYQFKSRISGGGYGAPPRFDSIR